MTRRDRTEIAVIGAGVVGLSVALRLAREGREVSLVAPEDGAEGASFGNAGVIADYAVLPIGTPEVLRALPELLFSRSSPLAIRHSALPTLLPWLMRFLRQSCPGAARRNARALAGLLSHAAAAWHEQAAEIGGEDLLRRRGVLHLYDSPREMAAAKAQIDWRRSLGVEVETLRREELDQLEPGLPSGAAAGGAAFFPHTRSLADPGAMISLLHDAVKAAGVARVHGRVTSLRRTGGDGVEVSGEGFALRARRAVIAAGAHSRPLARAAGDRVPLDTERGYHLEFDGQAPVTRPLTTVRRGFYFVPMRGRLRVAGTVELGGLDRPHTPRRLQALLEGARAVLPDLPEPDRKWMGFRPSVPDSVPVIGPSRGGREVVMAFGHGHLGLTLAPVTARMVADLVSGGRTADDLAPYLPTRF